MFGKNGYCAMLSFIVPEDLEKIDPVYAGAEVPQVRSYAGRPPHHAESPCHLLSHGRAVRPAGRWALTPGMIRVSVGIEDADDLAADFENALKVFD